jgi:hypothetical protein
MVGLTIVSVAVLSIYSVAAAGRRGSWDPNDHEAALDSLQAAVDALALYVSADMTSATSALAPGASWKLSGDACTDAFELDCTHDASVLVNERVRARNPAAKMTYTVSRPDGDAGSAEVAFQVQW